MFLKIKGATGGNLNVTDSDFHTLIINTDRIDVIGVYYKKKDLYSVRVGGGVVLVKKPEGEKIFNAIGVSL